jgi:hypothetical protein
MSKSLLIETIPFVPQPVKLTEGLKSKSGNMIVEGILATPEVKNGNGRYYSKDLWGREINKYYYSRPYIGLVAFFQNKYHSSFFGKIPLIVLVV